MIDKKRMKNIRKVPSELVPEELTELIYLAELGLWAKEYGIQELMQLIEENHLYFCNHIFDKTKHDSNECVSRNKAIKALP